MRRFRFALGVLLSITLLNANATFGQISKWRGGSGTNLDWRDGLNWEGGAPTDGDEIVFDTPGVISFQDMVPLADYLAIIINQGDVSLSHILTSDLTFMYITIEERRFSKNRS